MEYKSWLHNGKICCFLIQSTSAFSNTRCLKLFLWHTFSLVPSAFSFTSLINQVVVSNFAISNFHYVRQFSRTLQSFFGCFPPSISNIQQRFLKDHTVHLKHSNVTDCIDKTLFGSFFSKSFRQQNSSVKRKLNVKV